MNTECKFSELAGLTGYSQGCRCGRCCETKHNKTQRTLKNYTLNKALLKTLKVSCKDCGWNKIPPLLNFHHEVILKNKLSISATLRLNQERFLYELAKGCFLCPTCHALRHYNPITEQIEYQNSTLR